MLESQAAVIICTRNRTDDLARTMRSVTRQHGSDRRLVFLVDASDRNQLRQNRATAARYDSAPIRHIAYPGAPSLSRQRNFAVSLLSPSIQVVHFIDDDVSLYPGYFRSIEHVFATHPEIVGVGGVTLSTSSATPPRLHRRVWKRIFLQSSSRKGRVLVSGHTTTGQATDSTNRISTDWLAGCSSSYRRSVFDKQYFDPALEGYAMMEDTDFSYRLAQEAPLVIAPTARMIHHTSPVNRYDTTRYQRTALIHRYWFVEKNIRHPLRKPAFWWATLGQCLAMITSRKPAKWAALRGLLQGIRSIWWREHPLLEHAP